jgi:hypothetical protein
MSYEQAMADERYRHAMARWRETEQERDKLQAEVEQLRQADEASHRRAAVVPLIGGVPEVAAAAKLIELCCELAAKLGREKAIADTLRKRCEALEVLLKTAPIEHFRGCNGDDDCECPSAAWLLRRREVLDAAINAQAHAGGDKSGGAHK